MLTKGPTGRGGGKNFASLAAALEHLEDMATELKAKWHEDYASLEKMS